MRMIFIIFHFLHELLLLPLPVPLPSLPCFSCLVLQDLPFKRYYWAFERLKQDGIFTYIHKYIAFVSRKMLINQDVIRFMPMRRLNDVGMLIYRLFLVVKN